MATIRTLWNFLRGLVLLLALAIIFCGIVAVSCLGRLMLGAGMPGHAGRLHPGA